MKVSVITPCFNSIQTLEKTIRSVLSQTKEGIEIEYIIIDGGSTDGSLDLLKHYSHGISYCISESDVGPANAINKGLEKATGDIITWLNSDDLYFPDTLQRVCKVFTIYKKKAIAFGRCIIINEYDMEIRQCITLFKELFFPLSCRFTYQCINYISQPAAFFRRAAFKKAGPICEDLKAAWDYEFFLRLWKFGGAISIPGGPLAKFRWTKNSISGRHFVKQFKEEFNAAAKNAGPFSPQTLIHYCVQWIIILMYSLMTYTRDKN